MQPWSLALIPLHRASREQVCAMPLRPSAATGELTGLHSPAQGTGRAALSPGRYREVEKPPAVAWRGHQVPGTTGIWCWLEGSGSPGCRAMLQKEQGLVGSFWAL